MKKIKYVFFGILLMFCFCSPTLALYGDSVSDVDRSTLENNGVKKEWSINSSNINNVLQTPYVDAEKKIYDFADILTDEEENELREAVLKFKEEFKMEMVFLTINYSYTTDHQNDVVAADFYDYNDFGLDYEHYDGILFYRNAYSMDPFYDILTFGKAQLYFDDARYDSLLDGIYSDMTGHRYLEGFKKVISYSRNSIRKGIPSDNSNAYIGTKHEIINPYSRTKAVKNALPTAFIVASIISIAIVSIFSARNKMVIKATAANEYVDQNSFNLTNSVDQFLRTYTTQHDMSSSSSGGGHSSGGHSSFGSSGGGHSSGGGRHG